MINRIYIYTHGYDADGESFEVGVDEVTSIFVDKTVNEPVATVKYQSGLRVFKGIPFWYFYNRNEGVNV